MFRRLLKTKLKEIDLKKVDWKLENLNDRVLSCQGQIDVLYLCMAISGCFSIGTIFIKTVFECNK